jgi:hypothetical protein
MTIDEHGMPSSDDFTPHELFTPASVTGSERMDLTEMLESLGIDRLTVERGRDCQTLRRDSDGWYLTCRNSRY